MDDETTWRWALASVAVAAGGVSAYFRRRAARGAPVSRRAEGWPFFLGLRLGGIALGAVTLAYLVAPTLVASGSWSAPAALRAAAVPLGGLGVVLQFWTLFSLGGALTDTVAVRGDARLVTHGPYRYVRHPFYSAAAVLILSASLIAANLWIAAAGAWVLTLLVLRTGREERMLVERFGADYQDYQARTGRFWPRLPRTGRPA